MDGRLALITGTGSAGGIGFACARRLGLAGAAVAITSTTERIHERAGELREAGVTAVSSHVAHLPAPSHAARLAEAARAAHASRPIDVLVHAAGMVQQGVEVTSPPVAAT